MHEPVSPVAPALVLASASPRRLELLRQIGVEATVCIADIDETAAPGEGVSAQVSRLARAKALTVATRLGAERESLLQSSDDGALDAAEPPAVILAADTLIEADGRSLGKPRDRTDAIELLCFLQGRAHRVVTAVCVRAGNAEQIRCVTTTVHMGAIDRALASAYWDTGEPADKAGAYAIQGRAAAFVTAIQGSYSNVVGLPLYETAAMLAAAGVPVLAVAEPKH